MVKHAIECFGGRVCCLVYDRCLDINEEKEDADDDDDDNDDERDDMDYVGDIRSRLEGLNFSHRQLDDIQAKGALRKPFDEIIKGQSELHNAQNRRFLIIVD